MPASRPDASLPRWRAGRHPAALGPARLHPASQQGHDTGRAPGHGAGGSPHTAAGNPRDARVPVSSAAPRSPPAP